MCGRSDLKAESDAYSGGGIRPLTRTADSVIVESTFSAATRAAGISAFANVTSLRTSAPVVEDLAAEVPATSIPNGNLQIRDVV